VLRNFGCFKSENEKLKRAFREVYKVRASPKFSYACLISGDTGNTPEMKALQDIDGALLPMNLPYTMTPEMVADAARAFQPGILYPYHFGDTDKAKLTALLEDQKAIEVRIRRMP
jgi:hypothetical protein